MRSLLQQMILGWDLPTLGRVLKRQRFQVDPCYLPRLAVLWVIAAWNSYMARFEAAANHRRIAQTDLVAPPIFILGFWRSGTTHLHNLLSLDPSFTCPTAYQVMFPHHFVYSQSWGSKIFTALSPRTRPMDRVAFHGLAPHEEEMALAAMSGVSPYLRILFPRTATDGTTSLAPERIPAPELAAWQAAFRWFLKKLSFSKGKRIVLKSPPHMGRLRLLLSMFPGAKFVHIVRQPYVVYLSFQKNWQRGHALSHLQKPDPETIAELILAWYEELFSLYERDRALIPAGDLHELRFEELEADPKGSLRQLYENLGLPGFAEFWPRAEAYLASLAGYRKNTHLLTEAVRVRVTRRWGFAFARYGYEPLPPLKAGEALTLQ